MLCFLYITFRNFVLNVEIPRSNTPYHQAPRRSWDRVEFSPLLRFFVEIANNFVKLINIIHQESTKEIMSVKESVYPDTDFFVFYKLQL